METLPIEIISHIMDYVPIYTIEKNDLHKLTKKKILDILNKYFSSHPLRHINKPSSLKRWTKSQLINFILDYELEINL